MLIGQLARATGVTKDTIRYYERLGMLKSEPRRAGSRTYGDYDERSVEAVNKIKTLQHLGFSLIEIQPFVRESVAKHCGLEESREMIEKKLAQLREKRRHLDEVIDTLETQLRG